MFTCHMLLHRKQGKGSIALRGSMLWRPTKIRHGWRLLSPLQLLPENPAGESNMPTTTRKSNDIRNTCGFQSRGAARRCSSTESCRTTAAKKPSPTRSTTVWTAAPRSWPVLRRLLRSHQPSERPARRSGRAGMPPGTEPSEATAAPAQTPPHPA